MLVACAPAPMLSHVQGPHRLLLSPSTHHGARGIYTISALGGGRTGWYYDWGELAGLERPDAKKVVLLGMGGGEMLRAARRSLPAAELVGVELDERIAAAARREFGVEQFGVEVVVEEAALWLERQPNASIDVLMVDVFDGQTLPPRFRSPRFYAEARRVVGPLGALMQNVWPESMLELAADAMHRGGFPEVCVIDALHGNFMLWAGPLPYVAVDEWLNLKYRREL